MPQELRLIGMCIVLLYVLSAMILIGMSKIGGTMGAISKTEYRPGSSDAILNMSRWAKRLHVIIFGAAAVLAFWPNGG